MAKGLKGLSIVLIIKFNYRGLGRVNLSKNARAKVHLYPCTFGHITWPFKIWPISIFSLKFRSILWKYSLLLFVLILHLFSLDTLWYIKVPWHRSHSCKRFFWGKVLQPYHGLVIEKIFDLTIKQVRSLFLLRKNKEVHYCHILFAFFAIIRHKTSRKHNFC